MCAVPNTAVFCSSLISYPPGMLLKYFLNDFYVVLVAPIITGITCAFTFHTQLINIYETQEWPKVFIEVIMIAFKEAKTYKMQ
jgi:hypothetical protein